MCGIAGIFETDPRKPVSREQVVGMCDAIVHRGPDDQGQFVENNVGLGMRRLSIIDVAGGHQPICNEDQSVWIVFNGEIYNYRDLQQDLKARGHVFRTDSDGETIVHLYEEYGADCVKHLRGMFGFAIWDTRKRRLLIARDRLGIKPMFYSFAGGRLTFGSEMKSMLALPDVDTSMNWTALDAYFTYNYIPAPLTIYESIHKLLPAHTLIADENGIRIDRYWDVDFHPKHKGSAKQIAGDYLDLMKEAVGIRLMSEVPLGAFLSGGVDSSLIVALMSQASSEPVRTLNIGFGGETGNFLDERPFAKEVAERYNTLHQEFVVTPQVETALDAGLHAFDEPFADDSIIPTYYICQKAREQVTVVLTGLGGDENFAGYERHLGLWASRFFSLVPRLARDKVLGPLVSSLKEEKGGHYRINHLKRFVAAGGLPPGERYQSYLRTMKPDERARLYTPEIAQQVDFEYVERLGRQHFEKLEEGDILDRALYQDLMMYLPDDILALSDRLGMHHSLELRVPFVDHEVVEYCARIPSKMKIKAMQKKYLLKKASAPHIPDSVINHRKQGFAAPMAIWLRGDLQQWTADQLGSKDLSSYLQADFVQKMVRDHEERRSLNDKTVFAVLAFSRWLAHRRRPVRV